MRCSPPIGRCSPRDPARWLAVGDALRRWPALPVTYVAPHYNLLTPQLIETLHAAGKTVITWTVNDQQQMLRAAELGVDGIISDDTKLLVKTFRLSAANNRK